MRLVLVPRTIKGHLQTYTVYGVFWQRFCYVCACVLCMYVCVCTVKVSVCVCVDIVKEVCVCNGKLFDLEQRNTKSKCSWEKQCKTDQCIKEQLVGHPQKENMKESAFATMKCKQISAYELRPLTGAITVKNMYLTRKQCSTTCISQTCLSYSTCITLNPSDGQGITPHLALPKQLLYTHSWWNFTPQSPNPK